MKQKKEKNCQTFPTTKRKCAHKQATTKRRWLYKKRTNNEYPSGIGLDIGHDGPNPLLPLPSTPKENQTVTLLPSCSETVVPATTKKTTVAPSTTCALASLFAAPCPILPTKKESLTRIFLLMILQIILVRGADSLHKNNEVSQVSDEKNKSFRFPGPS